MADNNSARAIVVTSVFKGGWHASYIKSGLVTNRDVTGTIVKRRCNIQVNSKASPQFRADAEQAFDAFVTMYNDKYPKATECLEKDRVKLLAFYDFPAAHWQSIRTSNPIESTFATVRLRTAKTRGCVSRDTVLSLAFKLGQSAAKRWRRLRGYKRLERLDRRAIFVDGVEQTNDSETSRSPLDQFRIHHS